jgi:hypothetical protein
MYIPKYIHFFAHVRWIQFLIDQYNRSPLSALQRRGGRAMIVMAQVRSYVRRIGRFDSSSEATYF